MYHWVIFHWVLVLSFLTALLRGHTRCGSAVQRGFARAYQRIRISAGENRGRLVHAVAAKPLGWQMAPPELYRLVGQTVEFLLLPAGYCSPLAAVIEPSPAYLPGHS